MTRLMTAQDLREIIERQVPYLKTTGQLWLLDKQYAGLDPQVVLKKISPAIDPRYKRVHGEGWDCDNIAKNGETEAKKWLLQQLGGEMEAAFGVACGLKFRGVAENHTLNIGVFQKNVYFYDFQLDEWWPADPVNDTVYKVDL